MLGLVLVLGLTGCDSAVNPPFMPSKQEATRTMEAFMQIMAQLDQSDGVTETDLGDTEKRIDFDNVTTVYKGDTYVFNGFMSATVELDDEGEILSGSVSMKLTMSSTSLEGDIVIVLSMDIDSEENPTINTATINGIDYSNDESLWDVI